MGISDYKSKPLSAIRILKEAIKLPANNCILLHPIIILSFLSSSLTSLIGYHSVTPLLTDITTNAIVVGQGDRESPESSFLVAVITSDLKKLCAVGALYMIVSSIINSLLAIATIHVLSTAYSSKIAPTLKDLISRHNMSLIRRSMITQLYVALFQVGYIFLLLLSMVALVLFYLYKKSMAIVALGAIIALLVLHLYLAMVWAMSVVISVVSEGFYGVEAITKAGEIIRGRRRQAILIVFMELVAVAFVHAVYNVVTFYAPPNKVAGVAVGVGRVVMGVVVSLFVWSVHTVYYYECKKSHEEKIALGEGFMEIPIIAHVDGAYP